MRPRPTLESRWTVVVVRLAALVLVLVSMRTGVKAQTRDRSSTDGSRASIYRLPAAAESPSKLATRQASQHLGWNVDSRIVAAAHYGIDRVEADSAKRVTRPVYAPSSYASLRRVALQETDVMRSLPDIKPIQRIGLQAGSSEEVTPPDFAGRWFNQQYTVHHVMGTSRPWGITRYDWAAPAVAYGPLYFEDVNLERYGYSWGLLQPAVSTAHFFGNVAMLPYHIVDQHPCEYVYRLGFFQPGDCALPYHARLVPINPAAAAAEAATVAALILILP